MNDSFFKTSSTNSNINLNSNQNPNKNSNLVKIHKVIARRGYCSNRKAEELIKQNKVKVNSQIAHVGQLIEEDAIIEIDGTKIENVSNDENHYTFIMNKKIGDECSRNPFKNLNTSIFSCFNSQENYFSTLKCVGRLDVKTSGLMLLTTNGELIQQIIHPTSNISKTYIVGLNKTLNAKHREELLQNGVMIENSVSKPLCIKSLNYSTFTTKTKDQILLNFSIKDISKKYYWYEVVVKEGKKHIIRNFFEHFKYRVEILHRSKIGSLDLSKFNLKQGEFEKIDEKKLIKMIGCEKSNNTNS